MFKIYGKKKSRELERTSSGFPIGTRRTKRPRSGRRARFHVLLSSVGMKTSCAHSLRRNNAPFSFPFFRAPCTVRRRDQRALAHPFRNEIPYTEAKKATTIRGGQQPEPPGQDDKYTCTKEQCGVLVGR